ncbi:class I SAM-dependent methyltransferase [Psychrobacillus sp.]|uniref:class I SAM-dependent methyltransferase n=1 Tax=Psychrobacillus sp. TaxID=1871623 RepID=UPI0028BF1B86|nr:class I SAM-dependent methyltransferase [Psychrobacillus sp.]
MKDTVLFGASKFGESALKILQESKKIIGFIDNDENKWNTIFNGLPVYGPTFIKEHDIEVIITSTYANEIVNQLQELNFFDFSTYSIQLQKSNLINSKFVNHSLPIISIGKLLQDIGRDVSINDLTFLSGGSSVMDYFFLKAVMQRCNFRTYLEIGTWTGESIAAVAEIADKCYSISLPDDNEALFTTFKSYCNKANFSRYFSNNKDNIVHFYGDSLEFDYSQIKDEINLVFIDGDHSYDAIKQDTKNIFELVGYENSIIVWHDFKTIRNQVIQTTYEAIRAVLPQEYVKNLFVVHSSICGVYIPEKLQSKFTLESDSESLYSFEVSVKPKQNKL